MREATFVRRQQDRWHTFEQLLERPEQAHPDRLAELYVSLTDDLAYAQTYYPNSQTHQYLNELAFRVHQLLYRNKQESRGRLVTFWRDELPERFYRARRPLLYSFLIFTLSALIGAVSAAHDDTFVRLILGDGYVNMTLDNIERGDPMGVYKDPNRGGMFLYITINNIKVSFYAFALGLLVPVFGAGYVLFQNGVVLGVFQYFFYQKGLLWTSFLTIWIHGTLEISAIIIAGAAGMVMGRGLLFPGTYSRGEALRQGARHAVQLVIGLVPVFIAAGFLESFVTRLTGWPTAAKLSIIVLSALFIVYYVVVYPYLKHHFTDEPASDDAAAPAA